MLVCNDKTVCWWCDVEVDDFSYIEILDMSNMYDIRGIKVLLCVAKKRNRMRQKEFTFCRNSIYIIYASMNIICGSHVSRCVGVIVQKIHREN